MSISLPDSMVSDLDNVLSSRSFAGRSEVVRAALRSFFSSEASEPPRRGPRGATLTLVYPKGSERRIGLMRHEFSDVVKAAMHTDSETDCTELFMLHGSHDRLQEFVDQLRGDRDVRLAQLIFTDKGPSKSPA